MFRVEHEYVSGGTRCKWINFSHVSVNDRNTCNCLARAYCLLQLANHSSWQENCGITFAATTSAASLVSYL